MNNISSNTLKLLDASLSNWYPVGSLVPNLLGYQTVRWRKPRWIPKAPSKMYVVTHRKRPPLDEHKEVLRLFQNWKCFMRLTYNHCHTENEKDVGSEEIKLKLAEEEEKEHEQCMEYNRQENERVALLRKERLEKEKEELIESIKNFKKAEAIEAEIRREKALEKVREIEEMVVTFIEQEDLEKAIERALDNPVDYNFSIDEQGRQFKGRHTLPHLVDLEEMPRLPIKDEGLTNVF